MNYVTCDVHIQDIYISTSKDEHFMFIVSTSHPTWNYLPWKTPTTEQNTFHHNVFHPHFCNSHAIYTTHIFTINVQSIQDATLLGYTVKQASLLELSPLEGYQL